GDATRLSSWPKFLIVIAIAATPTCYFFIFGDSDRSVDVAIAPQATSVKFLPLQKPESPSAKARDGTIESRVEPEVQPTSSPPTARLDVKPPENGIEARPSQTLAEKARRPFSARGALSTCYPSASAVRQDHPRAWPSWTLRAPGHEGARCWYPATMGT